MKTIVVLIEKKFVCPVPVLAPDWWDDATARERLNTPKSLRFLGVAADSSDWEESDEQPAVRCVSAPAGPVTALLEYTDEERPAILENRGMPS